MRLRVPRALHEHRAIGRFVVVRVVVAIQPKGGRKRSLPRCRRARRGVGASGSTGERTGAEAQSEAGMGGVSSGSSAGGDERQSAALTLRGLRELHSDRVPRAVLRAVHFENRQVELVRERVHQRRLAAAERSAQNSAAVLLSQV